MPMNNILSDSPSLTNWTFSPVAATTATSSNITMLVAPKLNVWIHNYAWDPSLVAFMSWVNDSKINNRVIVYWPDNKVFDIA